MYKYIPDAFFQSFYDNNSQDKMMNMINTYLSCISDFLTENHFPVVTSNWQFNPRDGTFDGATYDYSGYEYFDGYVHKDMRNSHYLFITAFSPTNTRIYADIEPRQTTTPFLACFIFDDFDPSKYIYEQKNIQLVDCENVVGPYWDDYTSIHKTADQGDTPRFRIFGVRG